MSVDFRIFSGIIMICQRTAYYIGNLNNYTMLTIFKSKKAIIE